MSTMRSLEDGGQPRARIARRVSLALVAVVAVVVVAGGSLLLAWALDETHFDRPDEGFTEFATALETLPGVSHVESDRWVEAPFFSNPTSSVLVTVDESGLPGLIEAACASDYPGTVDWGIRVRSDHGAEISLHDDETAVSGTASCPDFGFDAVALVDALDVVAPGVSVQPAFFADRLFTLVAVGDPRDPTAEDYSSLLPLLERGGDLLRAAGLDEDASIGVNAPTLDVSTLPHDRENYLDLLAQLAADYGVTGFFVLEAGSSADGVARVQMVAPDPPRAAIEEAVRASRTPIAGLPIRFLEP